MESNIVPITDVKRYFLLADAGKGLFKEEESETQLREGYKIIFDEIFGLNDKELNERIRDKVRLGQYNSFEWHQGSVALEDIGPYPQMKGLDARLTVGNIPDTARAIEDVRDGKMILIYESTENAQWHEIKRDKKREFYFQRFINKSKSLLRRIDFIYERFPIILLPGGTIRGEYNQWIGKTNLDLPLCKIFDYDLDDGNDRGVSYAMAGIKSVNCFYSFL